LRGIAQGRESSAGSGRGRPDAHRIYASVTGGRRGEANSGGRETVAAGAASKNWSTNCVLREARGSSSTSAGRPRSAADGGKVAGAPSLALGRAAESRAEDAVALEQDVFAGASVDNRSP
jgi:hypothetical protein